MKKIYLAIFSLIAICQLKAQVPTCSLDPVFIAATKNGVWPDSATNFMPGTVGVPYIQNITVKVPLDTIQSTLKFCFNRVVLSTPTNVVNYNLPPGLNFGTSTSAVNNGTVNGSPSLKFPGNANNCASIYGTPTTAGTYTLFMKTDTYATLAFGNCPSSPNVDGGTNLNTTILDYYVITISPVAGINEQVNQNSFNLQARPNPFSSKTTIRFHVQDVANTEIKLFNALGQALYKDSFTSQIGENKYELNAENFPSGIYFYSIQYKNYSTSQRLIITKN